MHALPLLLSAALVGVALSQGHFRQQRVFFHQRPQQNFQRPQQNFQRQQQNFQRSQSGSGGLYLSWKDQPGQKFTWGQSHAQCERLGKRLISLDSPQKNNEITSLIANSGVKYIWTGGQRSGRGFQWANGSPVGNYGWGRTGGLGRPQPDNHEGNENCLAVLNRFYPGDGVTWHDVACDHTKPFICE